MTPPTIQLTTSPTPGRLHVSLDVSGTDAREVELVVCRDGRIVAYGTKAWDEAGHRHSPPEQQAEGGQPCE